MTLAYLALQVRQNTKSLQMENYARALDRVATMQANLARDGELSVIISRGAFEISSLSPRERLQFNWFFSEFFGALEFMFHANEKRVLSDQIWARWSSTAAFWLSLSGVQRWWRSLPVPFTPGFTAFVQSVLEETPYDPARVQRFEAFIADLRSPGGS